jgi:hypothetical protein
VDRHAWITQSWSPTAGPAFLNAKREAVLEPFYHRDHARNLDDAGSGLGLTIVAYVIRRQGGELDLENRPGGGLRARVRLPADLDPGPEGKKRCDRVGADFSPPLSHHRTCGSAYGGSSETREAQFDE